MRILHVVEASFAGVGRHVLDLARWQAAAGYEVHVLYSDRREEAAFKRCREAMTDVRWHRMSTRNRPCTADRPSLRLGISLCRKHQIEIVHGHSTKGGLLARIVGLRVSAKVLYTPNAFYSMNPTLRTPVRAIVGKMEKALAKITDAMIVVSPEEHRHAVMLGIEPARIHLVPNGISPNDPADGQRVRRELGLPCDGRPIVGFVGRLDQQKAPLDLVAVFAQVARDRKDVHFAIVGEGPLGERARRKALQTPELASRCHWLGRQDGFRSMAAFDVFVLPSRYEGFPYVLIEAAVNGLPIVTTRQACPSAIVRDGGNGFVCESGDVVGLGDAVSTLLADGEFRKQAASESRRVGRRFTLESMCRSINSLYESVLASPRSTSLSDRPHSKGTPGCRLDER